MEKERGYSAKVNFVSKDNITKKETIKLRSFNDMHSIDELISAGNDLIINLDYYAEVEVHNEKSDNTDYTKYVYVDKDGSMYISGSQSLHNEITDIYEELVGEDDVTVKVIAKESKNYKGKMFYTCILV
jgi:hypothetical protein